MRTAVFGRCFAAGFAVSAIVLFGAGCGSGGGTNTTNSPAATNNSAALATGRYADLVYTLTAPKKVYMVGEEIPLTFTIENTGKVVAFSDYAYGSVADTEMLKPDGTVAIPTTYYHAGTGPSLFSGRVIYEIGQTRTYPLSFGTATGYTPPGHYRIRAYAGSNLNARAVPAYALGTDFIEIEVR